MATEKTKTIDSYREIAEMTYELRKTAEFKAGEVSYADIGMPATDQNTIFYIPGFAGSFEGIKDLSVDLSANGEDRVIIVGQPKAYFGSRADILDLHADAVLAIIEKEGLQSQPLDTVVHSFGMMILERAAEKAKEKGYNCFDSSQGAHSYAVAPAGLIEGENLKALASRWTKFMKADSPVAKKYDSDKKIAKANTLSVSLHPIKTKKEIGALASRSLKLDRLNEVGLKPHVILFGGDKMFPYSGQKGEIGSVLERHLDDEAKHPFGGISMVADPRFVEAAKPASVDSNRDAGHGDVSYHPDRLARAIRKIREQDYISSL